MTCLVLKGGPVSERPEALQKPRVIQHVLRRGLRPPTVLVENVDGFFSIDRDKNDGANRRCEARGANRRAPRDGVERRRYRAAVALRGTIVTGAAAAVDGTKSFGWSRARHLVGRELRAAAPPVFRLAILQTPPPSTANPQGPRRGGM